MRNQLIRRPDEEDTDAGPVGGRSSASAAAWRFASTFLWSLNAGVFFGPWLGLSRSISSFDPDVFLAIGKKMIGNLAPVMPILMPAAILSTVTSVVLSWRERDSAFWPTFAALGLQVASLAVTLGIEVPIDDEIRQWNVETLPPDWRDARDRWERFHVVRTFASVAALALLISASLSGGRPERQPQEP